LGGSAGISQVFSFPANGADYGPESSNLTQAPDGKLYGLAQSDGPAGYGSLFAYDIQTNTYSPLVLFDSTAEYPQGGLVLATNGLMYGLTYTGDTAEGGTLFSYSPGADSVITLMALPVSANPISTLIQARNGNLYGLTQYDGPDSNGTIFQYNITTGIYSALYTFAAGTEPTGSLIEAGADTLYGMATYGGVNQAGDIFLYVVDSNKFIDLYDFGSAAFPSSGVVNIGGTLYGVTFGDGSGGAGTFFSYNISTSTYTDLHDFGVGTDGANPYGSVMQASDGNLYATTNNGGVYGLGTIFSYNVTTGTYAKEADLDTANGGIPAYGALTEYLSKPVILIQPTSISACQGSATALIAAVGGPSVSTQWQVSTNGGATFSNIIGDTNAVYIFSADTSQNAYQYRAIFSNTQGADTSAIATLTVGAAVYDTATVIGGVCTVTQAGGIYQWVKCSTHEVIANATTQSFTSTQNGDYQCVVTRGACVDTTNCVTVTAAGIDQISGFLFSLSPNPTSGSFTIQNNYSGALSVSIINLLGKRLKTFSMTGTLQAFDISDLAAGIYEVRISDTNQTLQVMKVVKE
jgi:uncharacterized repeat protein (TIGR03803 family)